MALRSKMDLHLENWAGKVPARVEAWLPRGQPGYWPLGGLHTKKIGQFCKLLVCFGAERKESVSEMVRLG